MSRTIYNVFIALIIGTFGFIIFKSFDEKIDKELQANEATKGLSKIRNALAYENKQIEKSLSSLDTKKEFKLSNNLTHNYILLKLAENSYKIYAIPKPYNLKSGEAVAKIFEVKYP